jgi:prepilin-type N-terminal cleavage/methylation domain-containing protein
MSQRGFTLIELMIVVIIIATLAAVSIPKFKEWREENPGAIAEVGEAVKEFKDGLSDSISDPVEPVVQQVQYMPYKRNTSDFICDDNEGFIYRKCKYRIGTIQNGSTQQDVFLKVNCSVSGEEFICN